MAVVPSRRQLLVGGLGAVVAATVPVLGATPAHSALVYRNYLRYTSWDTRQASFTYNGYGMHNHNPGAATFQYDSSFYTRCSDWAQSLNNFLAQLQPRWYIDWFGVKWTYRPYGANEDHPNSIAMDMSAIYFTKSGGGTDFVDMNISYRDGAGLAQKRRYVATAASLRVYFPEVLTWHWQYPSHADHIHLDINQYRPAGIDTNSEADTLIVQMAANYLSQDGTVIDGSWGPQTWAAYNRLLNAFGMPACGVVPTRSYLEMANFLQTIARTGFANRGAGAFRAC